MEFLPNFIFMTNFCEARGYEVDFVRTKKGIRCDVYFYKELFRKGSKVFDSCLDAQKSSYTTIYKILKNN